MASIQSGQGPARAIPRAEAVGSLLRPANVKAALADIYADQTCGLRSLVTATKSVELQKAARITDAEVRRIVQKQIDCGLDVVTDGELRRSSFLSSFQDSVDGLSPPSERLVVKDDQGNVTYEAFGEPIIAGQLRKANAALAEEATFLRSATDHLFKLTLPTPSYFYSPFVTVADGVYQRDREDLIADVVAIQKRMVAEAIAAGARYIQFDFPLYPALVDRVFAETLVTDLGITEQELLKRSLAADVAVTRGIPDDVIVSMHLCRGNIPGGFWNGALDPIAEQMFAELPHGRFLFEWEDIGRDGNYGAIKYVGKNQIMAMGLVSSKTAALESDDEIVRHLEEASQYLPMEQLALTTQCGFASFCTDHNIDAEEGQWRKLELIGRVADRVWGR